MQTPVGPSTSHHPLPQASCEVKGTQTNSPSRTSLLAASQAPSTATLPSASPRAQNPRLQSRPFSTTSPWQKKGGKAAREASRETANASSSGSTSETSNSSNSNSSSGSGSSDDASDFSALEAEIQKAIEKLRGDLSKLRSGGRFNPDVLEALRVQLGKASGSAMVKLGDVAQVVPKGRVVQVLVGEQDVSGNIFFSFVFGEGGMLMLC